MVANMGHLDRMVILKKPFDNIEVLQLAVGMTEKWQLNQQTKFQVDHLKASWVKAHLGNHSKSLVPRLALPGKSALV